MAEARPPSAPRSPDRRRVLVALGYAAAGTAALSRFGGTVGDGSAAAPGRRRARFDDRLPAPVTDPPALDGAPEEPGPNHLFERVIGRGRVIDPASGFDATADVGIDGGRITAISIDRLQGRRSIDASGLVVAPGFIDLLSYAPELPGAFYKIADGVTTNLGMHGINADAGDYFDRFEGTSPVHYGGAFDHPFIRDRLLGLNGAEEPEQGQIDQLAEECDRQLKDGWIGVDFEPEYVPGTTFAEMVAIARVAERRGVPCFFHGRYSAVGTNDRTLDEIVDVAKESGAAVHVEHLISTGGTYAMAASLDRLQRARDDGYDVTACMYPYTFWATYLASPRFSPGWQERFRIGYDDLQVAGTEERLTEATFEQYQADNALAAAYAIPEDDVRTCLRSPFVMIGSDAILTDGNNHPRATGCFARTLGRYAREERVVSLREALAKMTILPARRLEGRAPGLRTKGRLQRGADADITVFDPATVIDRSTVANPAQESVGMAWVLVGGEVVKSPDGVDRDQRAGRPIRSDLA